MQLSQISLALTRLGGVFSPAHLFTGGVNGAWYDPSDLTTLFQDSAGTTPVTAVEQPVGLMLDKSKGLVLGPDVVTNGNFATDSNWNKGTGWAISGGAAVATATSDPIFQGPATGTGVGTTVGKFYVATWDQVVTSGSTRFRSNTYSGNYASSGRQVYYFTADSQNIHIYGNSFTGTIDNLVVRELPGNHAYQSINTSRPTLRARYNLLTRSEEFDNAAVWVLNDVTISANATTAPNGANTADKLVEAATTSQHYASSLVVSFVANTAYTVSVYAKAAERSFLNISFSASAFSAVNRRAYFDLSNGTVSFVQSGVTASITPVGNGWYRCVSTATANTTASTPTFFGVMAAGSVEGDNTYTGNGTSGIFLWGAQLVPTAVFPSNTYQRVGAATDYATGAAFPPYLFFDGTDDSMLTNSVDFSGTDKMLVVAGVTKNSDALRGCIAELGNIGTPTAGSWFINGPLNGNANDYSFASGGTTAVSATYTNASVAAPTTNVLSGIGNIGAPVVTLRVNGVQAATSSTSQGTGNFGNYPLYIGRRNNASLPFNGQIYSLVIAGAAYSAGQISSTESWVAAKTPLGTI